MKRKTMTTKEMNKSADSIAPRTSFSSLPDDIILICLARVSRIHYPTLSLVSKGFRSLIASPELDATRSRIGKTDNFLYVCLYHDKSNPNLRWFLLSPITKQERLLPIPCFPHQHPQFHETVVSSGSEIYLIGGFVRRKRINQVLVLDGRSHQWRRLPNMRHFRGSSTEDELDAYVTDGKIYVIGGCRNTDWGEVYDPKTKTWEPTKDVTIQKSVVPDRWLMDGLKRKIRVLPDNLYMKSLMGNICLVEIDNMVCQVYVANGILRWYEPKEDLGWCSVKGLEHLSPDSVTYSCGGRRRVIVWWKSEARELKTAIWCAEISFERRGLGELWGFVQWSNNVLTLDGCDSSSNFLLNSVIVTY